ncbi:hypothetical protein ACLOJK_029511 [Asimina triloba]
MRGEGFRPNRFVLASLVSGCNRSSENVCVGIQIHGLVTKVALLRDVYVSSVILHLYDVCGFLLDVQRLFDEMPKRNVVSWSSLMVGYSKNGNPKEAVNAYRQMRWEGVEGNQNSFATVISSCGLLKDEFLGSQVFGLVVVSGFETNVSVANALISMFDSFGRVEDAVYVLASVGPKVPGPAEPARGSIAAKGLLSKCPSLEESSVATGFGVIANIRPRRRPLIASSSTAPAISDFIIRNLFGSHVPLSSRLGDGRGPPGENQPTGAQDMTSRGACDIIRGASMVEAKACWTTEAQATQSLTQEHWVAYERAWHVGAKKN